MKNNLETLEKFLQSKKQKFKGNLPYLLCFLGIFIILFAMHHLLTMYFDDFGNASLSYNQTSEEIIGTNYSLSQLWDWCKMIYMTWGGRILWASVILIPLLKFGAGIYFAIQSLVITLIFYFIYKIAEQITKKKHILIPVILLILYGLIKMPYLKEGIYWASASILYVWPLLPLFAFIYLYLKLSEKIENKEKVNYWIYLPILLILNFFATFSQEQIGVAMVVFLILFMILKHGKKWKQYNLLNIPNILVCFISFALLMLAPGNYARLDTLEAEFASLTLIGKVWKNLPSLLLIMFQSEMTIFIIILTIVFLACLIKYRNEFKIKNKTIILTNIFFVLFSILCLKLQTKFLIIGVLYGMAWILYIGIWMVIYCYQKKKMSILPIAISGCGSFFCLLISPSIGGRTVIPFLFFSFLLIVIFTNEFLTDSKLYVILFFIIAMIPFALKSAYNFGIIYNGYLLNYDIGRLNYDILEKHNGTDKNNITLYKSKDDTFGALMPYEELAKTTSMDYWIKEYFNIPQNVEFKWVDIYGDVRKDEE